VHVVGFIIRIYHDTRSPECQKGYTHTHTHTHIYIYIYIYINERPIRNATNF